MGERKGDLRIYVICCFFFACTIVGGIFLCMYIFLPDSESVTWYLFVGMALVAIPWLSWFIIFIYRCIGPVNAQEHHNNSNHDKSAAIWTPESPQTTSPGDAKSPGDSPIHGGDEENRDNGDVDDHESKNEQERPPFVMV